MFIDYYIFLQLFQYRCRVTVINVCLLYEVKYHEHDGRLSFPGYHLVVW